MAPYEALYEHKCRSPIELFDIGEATLVGHELVQLAIDKVNPIQERLLAAQSRQKYYADNRWRDLEFQKCIGDPTRVVPTDDLQMTEDLLYEEIPVSVPERQIRRQRNKEVASVKIL
ncbi:PREDICTED: uncharacterized protein LOC109241209 [Nicotiana attenuata]|uniref:uncharacterized protein LOC109241209 n=1 Tax=Nicotiana attenuata TaxID=49451 RepID=UPI0009052FBD|nr:PREDICTED: uncharacterized protein LOC109241209 [Nicotiana attenuata]